MLSGTLIDLNESVGLPKRERTIYLPDGSEMDFPGSYRPFPHEKHLRNINIDPSGLKEKHIWSMCFFAALFPIMKSHKDR